MDWIAFTMDFTVGEFPSKGEALAEVKGSLVSKVRGKKIRKGAYEYKSHSPEGDRVRTYWIMTREEALKEGWQG